MENKRRVALLPIEYNPKENVVVIQSPKRFVKAVETDLCNCKFGKVKDAVMIIGEIWDLRPNRAKEFKIIKRIVINSVNRN